MSEDRDGFRRLHPLTPVLRGWKVFAAAVAIAAQQAYGDVGLSWLLLGIAVSIPLGIAYGLLSWRNTHFRIGDDDLRLDTGVIFKRSRRVRLDRLQAVDVVRPLVARVLGLAELRLEVAGGSSSEAPLAYLSEAAAQRLRAELLARAAGLHHETPEAPEAVLLEVPLARLVEATLRSSAVVVGVAMLVVLGGVALALREWSVLGLAVPLLLASVPVTMSSVVAHFGFTVAESPDGLRVRRGLLETRAQTVPPGRVQAVRIVEPWLWRSQGWCRIEVDVAGYVGQGQEAASVLCPVAPRAEALRLLARVLPGVDVDAVAAGRRTCLGALARPVRLAGARCRSRRPGAGQPVRSADPGARRGAAREGAERPAEPGPGAASAGPGHRAPRHHPGTGHGQRGAPRGPGGPRAGRRRGRAGPGVPGGRRSRSVDEPSRRRPSTYRDAVTSRAEGTLDLADPTFVDDPYPTLARLRESAPLFWHEQTGQWLALTYAAANGLLRDRRFGRLWQDREPVEQFEPFNELHRNQMMENEPPAHTRLRSLVAKAFARGHVERLRPRVQAIADALIDAVDLSSFDLIADFAEPLPVAVIADLLGVPEEDQQLLRPWSAGIVAMYEYGRTEDAAARAVTAAAEFSAYMRELAEARRREPREDLVSHLVAAEDGGERLSSEELVASADPAAQRGARGVGERVRQRGRRPAREPGRARAGACRRRPCRAGDRGDDPL